MTTVLNGLIGGAIVALVATIAARLVGDEPSLVSKISGTGGTSPSRWSGLVLSLAYGSVAGGLFVALELFVFGGLGVPPSVGVALLAAGVWSAVLLAAAVAIWRFVLDAPSDRSRPGKLVVFHLVYGLGLGIWIRMTWIT